MAEVPWPTEPVEARLARAGYENKAHPVIYGFLHFMDPDGHKAVIAVTLGPHTQLSTADDEPGMNVWHVDLPTLPDDVAVVSPSVHFIGAWHSPNPVRFRLVDELDA